MLRVIKHKVKHLKSLYYLFNKRRIFPNKIIKDLIVNYIKNKPNQVPTNYNYTHFYYYST